MPEVVVVELEPGDGQAEVSEAVRAEVGQLRVGDVEADLGLGAELVCEGGGDLLVGVDALADDVDGAGAGVLAAAGAGGDLASHGAVQAGADADEGAEQRGAERGRGRGHGACATSVPTRLPAARAPCPCSPVSTARPDYHRLLACCCGL